MARKKLCKLCKEKGREREACPNNGEYCYACLQYLMALQAHEMAQKPVQKRLL